MHICSPVHFHPAREPWPEELIPHQVEVFLCSAAAQLSQSFQYTTFFFSPSSSLHVRCRAKIYGASNQSEQFSLLHFS